eukprot:2050982-Rhodomonas_salina.1
MSDPGSGRTWASSSLSAPSPCPITSRPSARSKSSLRLSSTMSARCPPPTYLLSTSYLPPTYLLPTSSPALPSSYLLSSFDFAPT